MSVTLKVQPNFSACYGGRRVKMGLLRLSPLLVFLMKEKHLPVMKALCKHPRMYRDSKVKRMKGKRKTGNLSLWGKENC